MDFYPTEAFHYRDPDPEIDVLVHMTPWDYMEGWMEDWDEGEDDSWMEDWEYPHDPCPWMEEDLMGIEWDETSYWI